MLSVAVLNVVASFQNGAMVNVEDCFGNTPLHVAAEFSLE
jgi:hypothetical protein